MEGERDAKENPSGKIGFGVFLILTQTMFGSVFLKNKETKEERTMKNSTRWILFLSGIVVSILCVHYILVPLWPSYPVMGLGYRHFGPRTFPWGSILGLLLTFVIGFAWFKILFPSSGTSSSSEKKAEDFCPFCVGEFEECERRKTKPV
jgi:hypothetical protein